MTKLYLGIVEPLSYSIKVFWYSVCESVRGQVISRSDTHTHRHSDYIVKPLERVDETGPRMEDWSHDRREMNFQVTPVRVLESVNQL